MSKGFHGGDALARAVESAYRNNQVDYSMPPMALVDENGNAVGKIQDGDTVIFCCRRGEREIELTEAFTDPNFTGFARKHMKDLLFAILTLYHEKFKDLPIAFAPECVDTPLAQVLSAHGIRQFHCAESEKFAHVTHFFNGGHSAPFPGEDDVSIPSPKGVAFDQVPELHLPKVCERVKQAINDQYGFIVANFANGDVIGHTSSTEAKLTAVNAVSEYVHEVTAHAKTKGYTILITADHGNIETLRDSQGKPHVAHTTSQVPFLVVDPRHESIVLRDGKLADVSPTILKILGIEKPALMQGESLITEGGVHNNRVMLLILDGWGIGSGDENDALFVADTEKWDALLTRYPNCRLDASGEAVGLQAGKAGNSEAGHTNLGAGRVVLQDDVRIDNAIADGTFEKNPVILSCIERAKENGRPLHLIALLTKRSSHGSIDYPIAITRMAEGVKDVFIHIIFDGRSTDPGSAPALLRELDSTLSSIGRGVIVDGVGRGIALDRDLNYDKIKRAYCSMTVGTEGNYKR